MNSTGQHQDVSATHIPPPVIISESEGRSRQKRAESGISRMAPTGSIMGEMRLPILVHGTVFPELIDCQVVNNGGNNLAQAVAQ